MKAIDYRNETFESLKNRINADRQRVLKAWRAYGPGTTAEVALRSAISILTFRPRTTELYQLGFVVLCDPNWLASSEETKPLVKVYGAGGMYRAATDDEARAHFEKQKLDAIRAAEQMHLAAIQG
ncbi:MAG: hypothetical protein PHI35_00705 [Victivallaceae bacterium]|nr:hypothetical protein [Victivallaceae bacterium]